MNAFVVSMILHVAAIYGYEFICPDRSHLRIYSKAACANPLEFSCLKDALVNKYRTRCYVSRPVAIGYKYVFRPDYDRDKCIPSRYQPFIFYRNKQTDCFYLKSNCNDEGQIMHSSGNTTSDVQCKCDERNGFTFVTQPRNKITCIPSEEDCSCYRKTNIAVTNNNPYITSRPNRTIYNDEGLMGFPTGSQVKETKYNKESGLSNKTTVIIFVAVMLFMIIVLGVGVIFLWTQIMNDNKDTEGEYAKGKTKQENKMSEIEMTEEGNDQGRADQTSDGKKDQESEVADKGLDKDAGDTEIPTADQTSDGKKDQESEVADKGLDKDAGDTEIPTADQTSDGKKDQESEVADKGLDKDAGDTEIPTADQTSDGKKDQESEVADKGLDKDAGDTEIPTADQTSDGKKDQESEVADKGLDKDAGDTEIPTADQTSDGKKDQESEVADKGLDKDAGDTEIPTADQTSDGKKDQESEVADKGLDKDAGDTEIPTADQTSDGKKDQESEVADKGLDKDAGDTETPTEKLPSAIKEMDEESLKLYKKALESGYEIKREVRVIVVGKKRAGKTCLIRRLQSKLINDVKATDGIEIHSIICSDGTQKDISWHEKTHTPDSRLRFCTKQTEKGTNSGPHDADQTSDGKKDQESEVADKGLDKDAGDTEIPTDSDGAKIVLAHSDEKDELLNQPEIKQIDMTSLTEEYTAGAKGLLTQFDKTDALFKEPGTKKQTETTPSTEEYRADSVGALEILAQSDKADELLKKPGNKHWTETTPLTEKNKAVSETINEHSGQSGNKQSTGIGNVFVPMETNKIQHDKDANIVQDIKDMEKAIEIDKSEIRISVWDFGGDEEFYYTHQLFLADDVVYLIVTSLEPGDYSDKFEFQFWFDTIHCLCKDPKQNELSPRCIVVGTKVDLCQEKNAGKVFEKKREYVPKTLRRHIYRKSFLISNKESDDKTDETITDIKVAIINAAKEGKEWETKHPMKFILLDKALDKKRRELKARPVITLGDIEEINNMSSQPLTEDELDLYLRYNHLAGHLIYYKDIPDYIVIVPQWLGDLFRCIITADKFRPTDLPQYDLEELRSTGKMTDTFLKDIFHTGNVDGELQPYLMKIMEKFHIVIELSQSTEDRSKMYFAPCMVNGTAYNVESFSKKEKSTWLCLESHFIPPFLFNHIIISFCEKYRGVGDLPKFFSDGTVLDISGNRCEKLVILRRNNIIQLQIIMMKDQRICRQYGYIKSFLEEKMTQLRKTFSMRIEYEYKWKCPDSLNKCSELMKMDDCREDEEYYCSLCATLHIFYNYWDEDTLQEKEASQQDFKEEEQQHHKKTEKIEDLDKQIADDHIPPHDKGIKINLLTGSRIIIGFGSSTTITAGIKCNLNEADLISINWQKVEDNVPVSLNLNTVKYSGSSLKLPTPELVINDAAQEDAGVYQLNVVGSTSTITSEPVVVELHGDAWQQFDKFVEHMDIQGVTEILDELISQCVILITDREEIEKPPSPRQRNEVLLDILKQRPFPTLSIFIDVLARAERNNPDVQEFALKYQQSTTTKIDNMEKTDHHPQNISGVADELVKLHKNYRTIVEGLDRYSTKDILDHLWQDAVIRQEDNEKISSCTTPHQMNRCLLFTIAQKGTTALRSLYKIIEKINVEMSQQIQNTDVTEQDKIRVLYGREDYKQRVTPQRRTFEVDDNTKRWILVGIELHTVLTPALRKYVTPRLEQLWTKLKTSHNIDTQIYPNHLKHHNSTYLNYETINNNRALGRSNQKGFNYCIKDAVDLSKLFLHPHMAHYSTFDEGCDASALLGIIIGTGICTPRGKESAEKVRSEIRNSWAHCDLRYWTDVKYTECLNLMIQLVQNIGFSAEEEKEVLQQLDKWKQNGKEFLGGKQPESFGLTDIQTEIQKLVRCVKTFTDDPKQIDTIQKTLSTVDTGSSF